LNKVWIAALAGVAASLTVAAEQPPQLHIADAWVRALPPTQTNTAAYMTVTNRGETAVKIAGATADIAQTVELHTTREIDGYMRMERLADLSVDPGEAVQLAPGGMHFMLLQLSHMPLPGETPRICLVLAAGGEVCVDAQVRKSAKASDGHDPHQHHHK